MSVKYYLDFGTDNPEKDYADEYMCFGHLHNISSKATKSQKKNFKGLALVLGPGSEYYEETVPQYRNKCERLYQELGFESLFQDRVEYTYNADEELVEIYFHADKVSTMEVVAAASVFRMNSDHKHVFKSYDRFVDQGYHPVVSFLASCNLFLDTAEKERKMFDVERYGRERVHLYQRSGHMPWGGEMANKSSIKNIIYRMKGNLEQQGKDSAYSVKYLTMKEQMDEIGSLRYNGRDIFFGGKSRSGNFGGSFRSQFYDDAAKTGIGYGDNNYTISDFYETLDKLQEAV